MKSRFGRFGLPGLFLIILFGMGCATTKVDWSHRIGSYTYDDAVLEMGVPDRQATLSDGTIVAEWLRRRGSAYGTSYGASPYFFHSRIQTFDLHQFPDRYIRLIFGPDLTLRAVENVAK